MAQSPAVIDQIIALASAGASRAVIADRLGLSRSAVCGILWRRGIGAPELVERVKRKPRRREPAPDPVPVEPIAPDPASFVCWAELDVMQCCCWPVSDDLWSGAPKASGSIAAAAPRAWWPGG